MSKPSWDDYFLRIAEAVSYRSSCDRARVGAVIVDTRTHRIVGTGYNGAPTRDDECDQVGHLIRDGHCVRTIHAEVNALSQVTDFSGDLAMYVTHKPCQLCMYEMEQRGITNIHYTREYP